MLGRARSAIVYDSDASRHASVSEIKELWRFRYLVRTLISKDLKVRYKRSALGFIWVMLNPLLTLGVMTVVFSSLFRFDVPFYPTYLLAGILLWNMFGQGSTASMSSLIGSGAVLKGMHVPPTVLIASSTGSALVNLSFAIVPFFFLAYINGVPVRVTWLFIVVPIAGITVLTFGLGLTIAALYIYFRDIFEIYNVVLTAYMYLTPVFYPVSILPPPLKAFENYNPMYLFLSDARLAVTTGTLPPLNQILIPWSYALGACLIGWILFTRLEGGFAQNL